jgi:hypothetical protein
MCGRELSLASTVIDASSDETVECSVCGSSNAVSSLYCARCGNKLLVTSAFPVGVGRGGLPVSGAGVTAGGDEPNPYTVSPRHESLLAKLDRMEQGLASMNSSDERSDDRGDAPAGDFDVHEEALKNISYTLDALISDLLEAEIKEYTFPDFIHPDESGFPLKEAVRAPKAPEKKSLQEFLVIAALIAAIFLVGLSCGLWGAYFFGL